MINFIAGLFIVTFGFGSFSQAKDLIFPEAFKWCVATAAHQIEGDNFNSDWWYFEQVPGNIQAGEKSGKTCDHWNQLEQDIQMLKDLHVKTYRFSIEWAKIQPKEGSWNQEAIAHYRKEIQLLKENGIEPMITLQHFTLPYWIVQKGSWEWTQFPQAFKSYTEVVLKKIAPEVRDWITFNEPLVLIGGGYMGGILPPKRKDMRAAGRAFVGMLKAHVEAYQTIHRMSAVKSVRVGFAHHLRLFSPRQWYNPFDWIAAYEVDKAWNWTFSEAPETGRFKLQLPFMISIDEEIPGLKGTQDFFGVNYYTRDQIHFSFSSLELERSPKEGALLNDLKWEIYPEGFYKTLKEVGRRFPGKTIIITENGVADSADKFRAEFLKSHLLALHRAIHEGLPIDAYCHWSLMDNFEWIEGFSPRFGLYEVDYRTQQRRPRPSSLIFSEIAKKNSLTVSDQ